MQYIFGHRYGFVRDFAFLFYRQSAFYTFLWQRTARPITPYPVLYHWRRDILRATRIYIWTDHPVTFYIDSEYIQDPRAE